MGVLVQFCLMGVFWVFFLNNFIVILVVHYSLREILVTLPGGGAYSRRKSSAIPISESARAVFSSVCPNTGTAAGVWDFKHVRRR